MPSNRPSRRSTSHFACIACFLAFHAGASELKPQTLSITNDRVVAHTSSAVIFSHGELELDGGPHLILLRNLSAPHFGNQSLEEQSLQVNPEGGSALVERIVWDDVPLATNEDLDALKVEIREVEGQFKRLEERIQLSESHMTTLGNFATNLVRPSSELVQKGEHVVNILKEAFAARVEVDETIDAMKNKRRLLDVKLEELRQQLNQASEPERVAKVYISVAEAGTVTFRLQRIVASVTWRPHYEIHVNSTGLVTIVYDALVHQQSGHDWNNVSMELCTGAPSADRRLPSLSAWFVSSRADYMRYASVDQERRHSKKAAKANAYSMSRSPRSAARTFKPEADLGDEEDDEDSGFQGFLASSEVVSSGISEVFVLPKRQTIPASQDVRVHISTISLKANLTYTAVPKKSTQVYVQAEVKNDSPFTLLPGSSLVFVDGSFVGSSSVNLIPTHGKARLDAGIDNALRVTRKIVSDEMKSTGGLLTGWTRTKDMKYELVLKSMRSFGVTVLVIDQVPLPQSEDLKVHVLEPEIGALRADHEPSQVASNITLHAGGEVRWEQYLRPDSILKIPLHFTVEVAAERHISNLEI